MSANALAVESAVAQKEALDLGTKTVNIQIAPGDLETLKAGHFKLCFAKKVAEGTYNVVWQSYDKYLQNDTFSWTPEYQLFGTNTFEANVTVTVATNSVTIELGEQCVLDAAGELGDPSTNAANPNSITLVNNFGTIHPGLNQLSTGIDGELVSTPIYVAPAPAILGTAVLTPVDKVLVWFEQNIETSTMFSDDRSNPVEIDLTFSSAQTRLYSNQTWSTPQ